jgi:bifunctional pyridoxal-dependent enzyme with beta-cystathionase and maltose regulon repressor activities
MTNEERLKDIQRMNAESIETINRLLADGFGDAYPQSASIMEATLKASEDNAEMLRTIINDNAYTDAMGSVLPNNK